MAPRRTDLAMVVLGILLLTLAPGAAGAVEGDPDPRELALAIYVDRCGIEPGSPQLQYSASDWDSLVSMGREPAWILEIARVIPADCSYVSFRSAILATERDLMRPPAPPPSAVDGDFTRPIARASRSAHTQAIRLYRAQCGPLPKADGGDDQLESEYQALITLRFPNLDADDIRDNARRQPFACGAGSFREGVLRVELDRLRLRRNIGFIGGGVLIGLAAAPLIVAAGTDDCRGGLECLGEGLAKFGGLTLGIAGVIAGSALVIAGAVEQHNVARVRRMLGDAEQLPVPGRVRIRPNGVGFTLAF
jgi:hypothetical protein